MLRFSILPLVCFQDSCWLVDQFPLRWFEEAHELQNLRQSAATLIMSVFSQIYSLFMTLGLILGRSGIFVENNASKCHFFGSIWSPFLLEVWDDAAFEEDEIFQGQFSIFCPFCVKNVRFLRYLCCLEKLINSFRKAESFLCKKLELV